MQFSVATYTLAPSPLTYGTLAGAVVIASILGVWIARRWDSQGMTAAGTRKLMRYLLLIAATAALVMATVILYEIIVRLFEPGACTYFVRPNGLALVIPPYVTVASIFWRRFSKPRLRGVLVGLLVILVWVNTISATAVLSEQAGFMKASARYSVKPKQPINYERQEAEPPNAELALARPFDEDGFDRLNSQTKDEVGAILGGTIRQR